MFKKIFLTTLFFTSLGYGFINVEPPVIGEKEGINAEVSLNADYNTGNSDKATVGTSTKGQYNSEEWLLYFIAAYSYGESNGEKDTNDGMIHLRYIHTLIEDSYDYEIFYQTEFNEFQNIRIRNLAGTNVRRKLHIGFDKFYLGTGVFYEYQKPDELAEENPIYKRAKLNTYISFLKKFNTHVNLTYLGYYQPNIEDFSDYTVSQTLQLNSLITENITLSIDLMHHYNTTPYQNVEKSDFRSTINLRYKLK
jgi:putative salt-induced outer membrane protein